MGRSFKSVRLGAPQVSARWARASRAMKKENQPYAQVLATVVQSAMPHCCRKPLTCLTF